MISSKTNPIFLWMFPDKTWCAGLLRGLAVAPSEYTAADDNIANKLVTGHYPGIPGWTIGA